MHKVLIVDDERLARDLIAELIIFFMPDSKLTQVDTAQKALLCLQAENYDLMFLDIEMPGMTGLQMLEKYTSSQESGSVLPYTFIITAFRKYDYAITGFRLGILDYIEKPLHKEKIYKAVRMYMDKIKTDTIELNVPDGLRRIQISRLLAIQSFGRKKVKVFTSDVIIPEAAHSLKQLFTQLPPNFSYIRRDCIVNVHEVKHYNQKAKEITISCQNQAYTFTVSRENMRELIVRFNPKEATSLII